MKSAPTHIRAAAVLVLFLSGPALRAQVPVLTAPLDEPEGLAPVEESPSIAVLVGEGRLVTLDVGVERVALADDKIARPQIISSREVLLTGLAPGRTTLFVWLADGQRRKYALSVEADPDLGLVRRALRELDPRIVVETSADGASVVLRGEVSEKRTAREAEARAASLLEGRARVVNILRYPGYAIPFAEQVEERLTAALYEVDPRIRVRSMQVGEEADPARDTFVLEGRVQDIHALKRAVMLAERQLGGVGSELKAAGDERLRFQRTRGFFGGAGGSGQVLQGTDPTPSGLSAKIARGLVVTSESGRVVSFLEIDELPQVLVAIRVVEVDRAKARRAGINWRFDNENLSLGSFLSSPTLPSGGGGPVSNEVARTPRRSVVRNGPTIDGALGGNIVGAFVDKASSIIAAVDFLEDKALARSVAEPNVLTLSGESATIVVGGEVPIPSTTVTQVSAVQGFFFQDFGVRLDIRPTVVDDDLIALEVSPSIVRPVASLGVGDVPGFRVQSVSTTARVQAGETLVLGGLLNFSEGLEERKIPGLGWLPGLGRWRRKSREEQELLFIISPRIVETPRAEAPPEKVDLDVAEAVELPELDWSEERRGWREEFEPQELRPDGVPPSFVPEDYVEPASERPAEMDDAPLAMVVPPPSVSGVGEPELIWEEPGVEPPAEATAEYAVVDADPCLRLRTEPGNWSPSIRCLPPDTAVEVLDSQVGWKKVRLSEEGVGGWVASRYLVPARLLEEDELAAARLEELTSERDQLQERLDAIEAADEELEEHLRRVREEIEKLLAETGGEEQDRD